MLLNLKSIKVICYFTIITILFLLLTTSILTSTIMHVCMHFLNMHDILVNDDNIMFLS